MSEKSDDSLSKLLRRWHEENLPTDADLDQLRGRISKIVGEAGVWGVPNAMPRRRWPLAASLYFALGVAAAVMVMLFFRLENPQRQSVATYLSKPQALPPVIQLPRSQLADMARLLAGMEETFNGRLAWLAEHGGRVELGLVPETERSTSDAKSLAVRVVVLARQNGKSAWEPVWQADAIARDDAIVDLPADSGRDGSLRLWMHALPDGAIAVDGDLAVSGARPVRSKFSSVQQGGVPQKVYSVKNADREYQVYQTVALLAAR